MAAATASAAQQQQQQQQDEGARPITALTAQEVCVFVWCLLGDCGTCSDHVTTHARAQGTTRNHHSTTTPNTLASLPQLKTNQPNPPPPQLVSVREGVESQCAELQERALQLQRLMGTFSTASRSIAALAESKQGASAAAARAKTARRLRQCARTKP
jgi:hypothetical protein